MSGFSRIQLAAALLEYDNENDNPDAPNRSAHESAIFLPFRQNAENRRAIPRKGDYLGVSTGDDGGSAALGHRQSRASINTLLNPFPVGDPEDEELEAEELEVDLASWGLDSFIPKDKASKNGKGKEKSTDVLPPHSVSSVPSHHPLTNHDSPVTSPKRALGASRSMSVGGNLEYFGTDLRRPGLSAIQMDDNRRRSIASPMDTIGMEPPQILQRRRASSYSVFTGQASSALESVPFPSTSIRSGSPVVNEDSRLRSSSFAGRLEPPSMHERALSNASVDSKLLFKEGEQPVDRQRTMSNATMATILMADDNPFAIRPPSRSSRFDPKAAAHARTMSNASMGSRVMLDQDAVSVRTSQVPDSQERRYSTTLDLLRPKVLVMPSPLQPTTASPGNDQVRAGFLLTSDGPPLPPGARSSRRASAAYSVIDAPPIASNSFTPNSTAALSLSQMTFRNTLKIGGQQDSVVDLNMPRATVDGEQAQFEPNFEDTPIIAVSDVDEPFKTARPAGKLFGKSLIDDLENRKAQMRSKQRTFTGDDRPSMMARGSNQRTSTLIDPAALQSRPVSQHLVSLGSPGGQQALGRRNSANVKPLLNFDDENKVAAHHTPGTRLPQGRSVFGVDTLWEKEMIKLKEIEAREKAAEEERKLREAAEEEEGGKKKKKKKGKRKDKSSPDLADDPENLTPHAPVEPRVSVEPPVLPDIPRAIRRPPPQVPDDASESDESDDAEPSKEKSSSDPNWHAVSSDEEEGGPRRTTGTGPRFPSGRRRQTKNTDDSDDEVPLSVAMSRVAQKHLAPDSDDERPLSTLQKKKQSSLLNVNFDNLLSQNQGDDDNEPLGIRASRLGGSVNRQTGDGDDDDRPLAFHPEQQRRSQFHMMAQQQQQQQQLMMQAQMQNSMYFSTPSMMGGPSPFFGPPMMPMMMQPPMPIPSPPPIHDQAKYNRVDSWRRDVAVEGEP
ncbi:hypothetical protein DXG03_002871 [Asterophora parasitica]|uniref:Uncharacterized protein n=1 Tax=Asterophora parasitica TaxID=117018 RepID=A0A9P7GAP2_9AGAR|nr:hypothetical protein DXG03_002871 [Asterophora parasitica]